MKTKMITSVMSIAALFLAGAVHAQESIIKCPVSSIETDVTTPLPGEWWSTPQGGKLSDTEVMNIGGRATLVCLYQMSGAEASVVREAPSGMDCSAIGSGFRCRGAYRQGDGSVGQAKRIEGQARHDVPVKIDDGKVLTPGNVVDRSGPKVRTRGTCPDPALTGVEVRMLSRDPQGQYFFRLAATVENLGRADYRSGAKQQSVDIYRMTSGGGSSRVGSFDFQSIPAGSDDIVATYDVLRWRISQEFPPSYRFNIVYGPDISADGNTANDDCTLTNNSTTITGSEINAIIRGSGI